jgi:hypothetical protein
MEIFKPDILTLPWATLLAIVSGYAAYYIANVGLRDHHKMADTIYSVTIFAFVAAFAYNICRIFFEISLVWSSVITFVSAMFAGAAWSLFGRSSLERLLRRSRISHADDLPSAWVALFGVKNPVTQLSVKLKDGSWLMCDDLSKFANSPNGPCILGANGDILMYVTHTQSDIGVAFFPAPDPIDENWGHEITYIPADQIARVDVRRKA